MIDLPPIGYSTNKEQSLVKYLSDCIKEYITIHDVDRRELIAALSVLCNVTFTKTTHFDVKEQCKEIEHFCDYLKDCAKGKYD